MANDITTVNDRAAREALVAVDGDLAYERASGNVYDYRSAAWALALERPLEQVNAKSHGARGDGGAAKITTADITANTDIWGALYEVGDTWDYVGLQESLFAAFAHTRIPTATHTTASTTTVLQFSGAPFLDPASGTPYSLGGATVWITSGARKGERRQILSNTSDSLTLVFALSGAPASGDTAHVVRWHATSTPAEKKALYTPQGNYNTGSKSLYLARVIGGVWRGAGRFATFIYSTGVRAPALEINGMSYSWIEGIQFQTRSAAWFNTTWRPNTPFAINDAIVPSHNGYIFLVTTAGTSTGSVVVNDAAATGGTGTTLVKAGANWSMEQHRNRWVVLVGGQGAGQMAQIATNSSDTLHIKDATFSPVPDATTVFDIVAEPNWPSYGGASTVTDGSVVWQRMAPTVVDLDWDGRGENWSGACQSNTFANCEFSGEGRGTPHNVRLAASGSGAMTSENTFLNCFFQWNTLGAIGIYGDNALQNTLVGGNIASSSKYGIFAAQGAFYLYSVGMQNGVKSQYENGGADIFAINSNNDHSIASGIRSESLIFAAMSTDHMLHAEACYANVSIAEWEPNHAYGVGDWVTGRPSDANRDGRIFRCVLAGTSGGTDPAWRNHGFNDYFSDGTVTWTLLDVNVVSGTVHLHNCAFPWGKWGGSHYPAAFEDMSFSRFDWMRAGLNPGAAAGRHLLPTFGVRQARVYRSYTAAPFLGGQVRWNPHGTFPASTAAGLPEEPSYERRSERGMWAITDLGAGGALYFTNRNASLGFRRGDFEADWRREVMAVEGKLGKVTPNNWDSTDQVALTYPADTRGDDQQLAGGFSTGNKPGGRIDFETASPGSQGTGVNIAIKRAAVTAPASASSPAGLVVAPGLGADPIMRDVQRTVTFDPPSIADGAFSSATITVFGAVLGDAASAAFSQTLPEGMWLSATVVATDRVRVTFHNESGAAQNLASGTLRIEVRSRQAVPPGSGDIAQLVADLGGNAVIDAVYDCRAGVTNVGGVASDWSDARGGGFGPTLSQATGSKRPAILADGTLAFDGDDQMVTPTSPKFDLSGTKTIVFIGSCGANGSGGNQYTTTGIAKPDLSKVFGLAGNAYGSGVGDRHHLAARTTNTPATSDVYYGDNETRLIIMGRDSTTASIEITDRPAVSVSSLAPAAEDLAFYINGDFGSAGAYHTVRAIVVLNKLLSADEKALLRQWAMTRHQPLMASA